MEKQLLDQVHHVCEPYVEALGLALVDVQWMPLPGSRRLVISIAKLDGSSVGITDCTAVTQAISAALDAMEDLVGYVLEVSSPGLDRSLKRLREYEIFRGRLAKLVVRQGEGGWRELVGTLQGVLDGQVLVATDGGTVEHITYEHIKTCRLQFKAK